MTSRSDPPGGTAGYRIPRDTVHEPHHGPNGLASSNGMSANGMSANGVSNNGVVSGAPHPNGVHQASVHAHDPHSPGRLSPATFLSLHGIDPATGSEATWHVTSLAEDGAPTTYLLEHAEGDIHNPAVWMQTQRNAMLAGETEVIDLVRSVLFGNRADPAPGSA